MPFQFWLPRAMAAPTPVSAYLHSAAMVAAGVFLLQPHLPAAAAAPSWCSTACSRSGWPRSRSAACSRCRRDELKQVLAHSTVSQYGYVVVALGLGGAKGALAACFYVLAHARGQERAVPDRAAR